MKGLSRKKDGETVTDRDFERIVRDFSGMVYRVAMNICRNPHNSEDVMQNVFLRLYKLAQRNDFATEEHLKAWLIRVTVNESKRMLKSLSKRDYVPLEDVAKEIFTDNIHSREVYCQVMKLPVKYRVVVYLYYYEGYSVKEISHILSRKEATIRTQLSRSREMLRLEIEENDYD